jgi:hypothetical protein
MSSQPIAAFKALLSHMHLKLSCWCGLSHVGTSMHSNYIPARACGYGLLSGAETIEESVEGKPILQPTVRQGLTESLRVQKVKVVLQGAVDYFSASAFLR